MIKISGNNIVDNNGKIIKSFRDNGDGTATSRWESTGVEETVITEIKDWMMANLLSMTTQGYGGLMPLEEEWQRALYAKRVRKGSNTERAICGAISGDKDAGRLGYAR